MADAGGTVGGGGQGVHSAAIGHWIKTRQEGPGQERNAGGSEMCPRQTRARGRGPRLPRATKAKLRLLDPGSKRPAGQLPPCWPQDGLEGP